MAKKEIVYVLHGYWHTAETDGVVILGLYKDFEKAAEKLEEVTETQASEWVTFSNDYAYEYEETKTERIYEIIYHDSDDYAKFYITEEAVK